MSTLEYGSAPPESYEEQAKAYVADLDAYLRQFGGAARLKSVEGDIAEVEAKMPRPVEHIVINYHVGDVPA